MAEDLGFARNPHGPGRSIDLDGEPVADHNALANVSGHAMDSPAMRAIHRQVLEWLYYERDRQSTNRLEMATDHDFYDGFQWDPEDKAIVEERGQMALVYNEVAPMADWVIGTERRARVDWKVLPRTEDDVELADIKTKVLKYVSDVNRVPFNRSRAFSDAVKVGEGWVDDGARDDPTKDVIYSGYEDWRNVLMDSAGLDPCGADARFVFRWRWVDHDIAVMMFPDRTDKIREAIEDWGFESDPDDETASWGAPLDSVGKRGTMSPLSRSGIAVDPKRRRVKIYECQWRKPETAKYVASGPWRGALFDPRDQALSAAVGAQRATIVDRVSMRTYVTMFLETCMLAHSPTIYRHNDFSLTRILCYRAGRDRMPYGIIRRVRSIQQDLNKRASKALHILNTNQVIADRDAFEDVERAREEAADPNGMLLKKAGSEVQFHRDTDAATGQLQIMVADAQSIQKNAGVTDENLGRKTNAISGEAIKARQMQGSVVLTEPFDNERYAVQAQGEKQTSNIEQFYTEEKVLRLTGSAGPLEWVKINQPEVQPDGSVRFLNDVTSSKADFIVSEADHAGTLRQVMFDSLNQIAQRLPPELALRLLQMAYEYSDLPNKDAIAEKIRSMTGEPKADGKMTPEEQAKAEQGAQMQAEAVQMQREQAMAVLEEQRAKSREINARAEKLLAEVEQIRLGAGQGVDDGRLAQAVAQVREEAASQIDDLSQKLAKATSTGERDILKIRTDADTAEQVARIQAEASVRSAEISADQDKTFKALMERLDTIETMFNESAPGSKKK